MLRTETTSNTYANTLRKNGKNAVAALVAAAALAGCGASTQNVRSESEASGNMPAVSAKDVKPEVTPSEAQAILEKIRSQFAQGRMEFPIKKDGENVKEVVKTQIEDLQNNYNPPLKLDGLSADQIVSVLSYTPLFIEVKGDQANTQSVSLSTPLSPEDKLVVDFGYSGEIPGSSTSETQSDEDTATAAPSPTPSVTDSSSQPTTNNPFS